MDILGFKRELQKLYPGKSITATIRDFQEDDSSKVYTTLVLVVQGPSCIYNLIGEVTLSQLPGCCGTGVLHNFSLNSYQPGEISKVVELLERGLISVFQEHKENPFTHYIATTIESQTNFVKILRGVGFTVKDSFVNANTGNEVTLWTYIDPEVIFEEESSQEDDYYEDSEEDLED